MYCCKCDKPLSNCTCPDLKERLEKLSQSKNLFIDPEYKQILDKQAKKNKNEKDLAE